MKVEDIVLEVAESKKHFKTADVVAVMDKNTASDRTYVSTVIASLVKRGILVREGSGRWSVYALPKYADTLGKRIKKRLRNESLEEYAVFDSIKKEKPFINALRENIQSIFAYAFSEMLNNAIEHSHSKNIELSVTQQNDKLNFIVRDFGVGVFRNVMKERKLDSEFEAIQDLLKGKTTTAPQAHSGEGIFFTSKSGNLFILESFGLRLRIDNDVNDIFIEEVKPELQGTQVTFSIDTKSKKHLSDIFAEFQIDPEVPAFDKTEIQVKLYTRGTIYVSRSQARRVLSDLNKFRKIILDFSQVPTIGQAFADEIFRVFQRRHPEIEIVAVNAGKAVQFMIDRVEKNEVVQE